VAPAVVDGLEVVQVHKQDREGGVGPGAAREGVGDACGEQAAVAQVGERVVQGLMHLARAKQAALAHERPQQQAGEGHGQQPEL